MRDARCWPIAAVAAAVLAVACAGTGRAAKRSAFDMDVEALQARGDWKGLEQLASARLRVAPKDPNALMILVAALHKEGRPAEAVGPARTLVTLTNDATAKNLLGQSLLATGDGPGAERQFLEVLQRDDGQVEAHLGLVAALATQARYREAAKALGHARGKLGGRLGLAPEVEHFYLAAGEWTYPDAALHAFARGTSLMMQQRWAEAVRETRRAVEAAPTFARARHQLARALAYSGDDRAAEAELRLALDAYSPADRLLAAEARADLAYLIAGDGRAGQIEARDALRDAVAASPRPEWLAQLADVCARLDDRECTLVNAYRVTRLVPPGGSSPDQEYRGAAAAHLRGVGCWSDAAGNFDLKQCVSAESAASCRKGADLASERPTEEGIEAMERGVAAGPQHAVCWTNLAWALDATDETVRAEGAYRSALAGPAGSLDDVLRARVQGALASLLIRRGSTEPEVVELARHARARLGDEAFYVLVLGRACEVTGDSACAIESFRRVLAIEDADDATRSRAAERLRILGVSDVPAVVAPSI